jgi:hypothetical protein
MLHTSEICIQHPATIFSHEELQLKEAGSFTLPASFCIPAIADNPAFRKSLLAKPVFKMAMD